MEGFGGIGSLGAFVCVFILSTSQCCLELSTKCGIFVFGIDFFTTLPDEDVVDEDHYPTPINSLW